MQPPPKRSSNQPNKKLFSRAYHTLQSWLVFLSSFCPPSSFMCTVSATPASLEAWEIGLHIYSNGSPSQFLCVSALFYIFYFFIKEFLDLFLQFSNSLFTSVPSMVLSFQLLYYIYMFIYTCIKHALFPTGTARHSINKCWVEMMRTGRI